MAFTLLLPETDVTGKSFNNEGGRSECVEFVRRSTGLPETARWRPGKHVVDCKPGEIPPKTAIATFEAGKYPGDSDPLGHHAAIYLKHNATYITVLDQWYDRKKKKSRPVGRRDIPFKPVHGRRDPGYRRSNDGTTFWTVEVIDGG